MLQVPAQSASQYAVPTPTSQQVSRVYEALLPHLGGNRIMLATTLGGQQGNATYHTWWGGQHDNASYGQQGNASYHTWGAT